MSHAINSIFYLKCHSWQSQKANFALDWGLDPLPAVLLASKCDWTALENKWEGFTEVTVIQMNKGQEKDMYRTILGSLKAYIQLLKNLSNTFSIV